MKRFFAWLLLFATLFSLLGCTGEAPAEASASPAEIPDTAAAEIPTETTEPPLEGNLFLKVSSLTFSFVGESEDIYLGLIPREEVTWESEDPAVISVENGILTANSVGSTTIHGRYADREVSCTAACLAETQEELESLPFDILSRPKRLPPEVDMTQDCTYFEDAAIFGDSITYFLWQSESQNNYLGNMQFVTRQGISVMGLALRYKNLYFKGREMRIEDIAAQCGAKRIYMMLGCLDFQFPAGRDTLMDNWSTILDRIQEKCPDLEIVIISAIPSFIGENRQSDINDYIADSNIRLRALAAEKNCGFIDLGYYIEDHWGRMAAPYSKDDYHMNDTGSIVWMQLMRYYAQYALEGGILS